jgi:hypothetical protein
MTENGIGKIVKELEKSNDSQGVIFDAITDFNPVLNSPHIHDILDNTPLFMAGVATEIARIADTVENLFDLLNGNKLQDAENSREMIAALSGGGSSATPPPLPGQDNGGGGGENGKVGPGWFSTILLAFRQGLSKGFAKFLPASVLTSFGTLSKVFKTIFKLSKVMLKFAGPIGVAISVILGLIDAIKGGLAGYKEDGIVGAIKGAIVGFVDGAIGSLVTLLADAVGWLLSALGMDNIGKMLGPAVGDIFGNIFKQIGGWVDLIVGIFTLDSDKVIGAAKTLFTAAIDNLKILGNLIVTGIKDLIPFLWKSIWFWVADLPLMIVKLLVGAWPLIKEGIAKLIKFGAEMFVAIWYDLLPWVSTKLGELLVSLSTSLSELFTELKDWVMGLFSWENIQQKLKEGFGFGEEVGSMLTKLLKAITTWVKDAIKSILPDPDSVLGRMIPDSVYESAGIDRNLWSEEQKKTKDKDKDKEVKEDLTDEQKLARAKKQGWRSWEEYENNKWKKKLTPAEEAAKAKKHGWDSWKEYEAAKWERNPNAKLEPEELSPVQIKARARIPGSGAEDIKPRPSVNGELLNQQSSNGNNAPVIINNLGGNVTNNSSAMVNNNSSSFDPIVSGAGMGFASV